MTLLAKRGMSHVLLVRFGRPTFYDDVQQQTNQPTTSDDATAMATNEYRFIRELNGPPLGRSLEIFKSTCLWHSLEPAPADTFAAAAHHKAGVTALDIDRQQGR